MDTHEPSEASEAAEPDLQEIVSRWAGESRQLLLALPVVLAQLEELREEREALRNRLMDLEQENLMLRESRDGLAESFARLKDLMTEATVSDAAPAGSAAQSAAPAPGAPIADVEPEPATLGAPARYVTAPSTAAAGEVTPAPTPPSLVRDVDEMPPSRPPADDAAPVPATPVREAAPEPSPPSPEPQPPPVTQAAAAPPAPAPAPDQASSDPAPPVTSEPVAEKDKSTAPSQPSPEPKDDKRPLPPRVEPSPVRLAAVFRPPAKK